MSIAPATCKGPHSMNIMCPYIVYDYVDYGRQVVSVDFLVPNQHRRFFRLNVLDNKVLELVVVIPNVFLNANRMLNLHAGNGKHHKNTHKQTAFSQICKKIKKKEAVDVPGNDDDDGDGQWEIGSKPQLIELPFTVETELYKGRSNKGLGCQAPVTENEDAVLFEELDQQETDFLILSVDVASNEKEPAKKACGAMTKLKSPARRLQDVDSSDEEEQQQEQMEEEG